MSQIGRHALSRFLTLSRPFFHSELRWKAFLLLGLLVALVFALTGLNAVNSYVFTGRFMTALQKQAAPEFWFYGLLSVGIFGLLTLAGVSKTFIEQRFALLWRWWLTRHLTDRYLANHAYYHLNQGGAIDNPDQRIAEDVRTFTETSLSLGLILFNAALTLFSFSGILWSITPWLLLVALGYAAVGSFLTLLVGGRLVRMNVFRLKQEADLRCALIHVRENAEPVALLHGEEAENAQVRSRVEILVDNLRSIIAVNRNLGFFTIAYKYLIPLIPVLIVAPQFIAGKVEFGVVTQAVTVFAFVLDAFSVIVNEFQRLSGFAADIERLGSLWEAIEGAPGPGAPTITLAQEGNRFRFEGVTLRSERVFVQNLNLEIRPGQRLLILGPRDSGRSALLRAIAGLWREGSGRITRPALTEVMFLPQKPFLPVGSLRNLLVYGIPDKVSQGRLLNVLAQVGLEPLLDRAGGLDTECNWSALFSLADQQLLAVARLFLANPTFAFLDEATHALNESQVRHLYETLLRTGITYISATSEATLAEYHDEILHLHDDGTWTLIPTAPPLAAGA